MNSHPDRELGPRTETPEPPRVLVIETERLLAHLLAVGGLTYVYGSRLRPTHPRYGLN
ncbi:MAG: hypothetical protein JO092_03235 [Candidatus Eremiobacteraeota bacterium]|nr:hypothetical protein [Candidatus Eremiobacteraeota bacterium]MBV8374517.1 hypothetical protein [Candidatus Eremiobacteraeota bacterium]